MKYRVNTKEEQKPQKKAETKKPQIKKGKTKLPIKKTKKVSKK